MTITIKGLRLVTIEEIDKELGYHWRMGNVDDYEGGLYTVTLDDCAFFISPEKDYIKLSTVIDTWWLDKAYQLFDDGFVEITIT